MKGFEQALKEADEILELPKGAKIPFRKIPACPEGFWMGSRGYNPNEEPRHLVQMSEFWLASVPVTQEQFAEFQGDKKSQSDKEIWNPVEVESDGDGTAFCHWAMQLPAWRVLKEKILKADDERGGLILAIPSEAQWEYACRAGSETEYWNGDGEEALGEVAWFGEDRDSPHPVAQKRDNDFGLYDVHGNVWELCRDAHSEDVYRRRVSGENESENLGNVGACRVLRGGSYYDSASVCRSAFRLRDWPIDRLMCHGFRLGLFPGPVEQVWPEAAPGALAGQGGTTQTAPEREGNASLKDANFSQRSGDDFKTNKKQDDE